MIVHYETTTLRCIFVICLLVLLVGCATTEPTFPEKTFQTLKRANPQLKSCHAALANIEETISNHHRQDAGEQKVERFTYLRTNRLLAALANADLSNEQQQQLFELLEQTGRFALQTEARNLPPAQRRQLSDNLRHWLTDQSTEQIIELCTRYLAEIELRNQPIADYVQARLHVDDHYKTWQRIVGFYYLTLFPVLIGIDNWHDETLAVFDQPVNELPVTGELQRYKLEAIDQSLTYRETAQILRQARSNPLHVPMPNDTQRHQLFASYAPVFEIDIAFNDDRIGTPYWPSLNAAVPDIDVRRPAFYTKLSHVLFQNDILLQLNYMIWFPARPCTGTFDILCGHIDGLVWRVTLANDGTPLLFDSMHSCGCYHQFFPSPRLRLKQSESWLQEPVLVPTTLPHVAADEQIVVRLAHTSHYINAVTIEPKSMETSPDTAIVPRQRYDVLRSIPIDNHYYRSLFDASGLVPGTQRPERFILWPMGVPSPGAMRQWGTHATAFVGRRHFDEPCLIEGIFEIKTEGATEIKEKQFITDRIYQGLCSNKTPQPYFDDDAK